MMRAREGKNYNRSNGIRESNERGPGRKLRHMSNESCTVKFGKIK
jgi:hypothetical protein